MSFTPSLSSTTYLSPSSTSRSLHFTHYNPSSSPLAAELWTNFPHSSTWRAIPFLPSPSPTLKHLEIASISYDTLEEGEWEFTYRLDHGDGNYEWLGDQGGNGKIVVCEHNQEEEEELDFLGQEWEKREKGVWVGRFRVDKGEDKGTFGMGNVVEKWRGDQVVEGLVLEQSSRTWFIPRHLYPSSTTSELVHQLSPSFASPLLILRTLPSQSSPSKLLIIYPFSTKKVATSLKGSNEGLVIECTREGATSTESIQAGCVVVTGFEREGVVDLVQKAVEEAREYLYPNSKSNSTSSDLNSTNRESNDISLCTWNALGPSYTLSSLLKWLRTLLSPQNTSRDLIESFKRGGVLLDDGWQDTESFGGREGGSTWNDQLRGLKSFGVREGWFDLEEEFEGDRSEEGWELRECVKRVKGMGIEKIGVWITITGYWNGLHPTFTLFPTTLATFSSPPHDKFHYVSPLPTLSSLRLFFSTYFDQLSKSGITFIKIDNQALIDTLVSLSDGTPPGQYRTELLTVLQEEGDRVFGLKNLTFCMAHSTRIWSGPLALSPSTSTSKAKPVLRNSDDYFPEVEDSHRWHLYINSINLVLTRNLNFTPDLDMAQESHEYGSFHISARAFSTAGLYCTDQVGGDGKGKLGESEKGWKGILGISKSGIRVLQAKGLAGCIVGNQVFEGKKIMEGEGQGGGEALKIGLNCERARGMTVGLWNCQREGSVRGKLLVQDVKEVMGNEMKEEDYVLFMNEAFGGPEGTTTRARSIVTLIPSDTLNQSIPPTLSLPLATTLLPPHSVQIARIVKLSKLPSSRDQGTSIQIACLGLIDKFVGLEAIRTIEIVDSQPSKPLVIKKNQPRQLYETRRISSPSPHHSSSLSTSSSSSSFPTPPPGTHVPFLLTYFSNLFVPHPPHPTSSSPLPPARTPSSELTSLFKSLLRRPISTLVREVRGIFSFGLAVVVWAFRSRRRNSKNSSKQEIESQLEETKSEIITEEEEQIEEEEIVTSASESNTVLRVELEFISEHLAFFISPPITTSKDLAVKLDGKLIEECFIKLEESGLMEIDIEGAWIEGGKRTKLGSDSWIVEVAYRG